VLACAVLALASAAICPAARAEVKTRTTADGTLEIYNDGPTRTLAPRTLRLRPVPRAEYGAWIRQHADFHGVDPRLVQAIVQVESDYNARARSRVGAVGLMQLMPDTARSVRVGNRYDPEQNIRGGCAYLRQMIDLFSGRLELAIAAYNAGPNAVQRYNGIPPFAETREYVDRVLTLYRGGSTIQIGFGGGLAVPQLNGLAQDQVPSPLQQALSKGLLASPRPTMVAPDPVSPVELEPSQPIVPGVVPASLPVTAAPAAPLPTTGG
jgi:transglycosylase-like protein with SLT domain